MATSARPLGISDLPMSWYRDVRFLRHSLDIWRASGPLTRHRYNIDLYRVIELFRRIPAEWHSTCFIACGSDATVADGRLPGRDCECIHGKFWSPDACSAVQVRLSNDSCSWMKHEQQGLLIRARPRHASDEATQSNRSQVRCTLSVGPTAGPPGDRSDFRL